MLTAAAVVQPDKAGRIYHIEASDENLRIRFSQERCDRGLGILGWTFSTNVSGKRKTTGWEAQ